MTDEMMNLRALVEKTPDADLLREMIGFAAERAKSARNGAMLELPWRDRRACCVTLRNGSCPLGWCSLVLVTTVTGLGRIGQLAIAGRLTAGSSLKGAIVSSVM